MNKSLLFTITLLLGGALFVFVLNKVGIGRITEIIITFKAWHFAVLIILNAAGSIISAFRWKTILDTSGNIIPFKKIYAARMIGNSINYLTPSGIVLGEPFKAIALSEKTNISLGSAMVTIIIEGSIFLSTLLLFIIIGFFGFFYYSAVSIKALMIILTALALFICIFYLFYTKMIKPARAEEEKGFFTYLIDLFHLHKIPFIDNLKNKISRRENEIKNFFQLHKKTAISAILLSFAELAVMLASYWLTLYFLGFSADIRALFGLYSLMNIAYLVPLPASLGGFEVSQIFAFNFFGLGGEVIAIAFTLITRIVSLVLVALGLAFLIQFEIDTIIQKITIFFARLGQKIRNLFLH